MTRSGCCQARTCGGTAWVPSTRRSSQRSGWGMRRPPGEPHCAISTTRSKGSRRCSRPCEAVPRLLGHRSHRPDRLRGKEVEASGIDQVIDVDALVLAVHGLPDDVRWGVADRAESVRDGAEAAAHEVRVAESGRDLRQQLCPRVVFGQEVLAYLV